MEAIMAVIVWVAALGFIVLAGNEWDRRRWNGGRCHRHGRVWRYFDTDSQGGRGYRCGAPGESTDRHGRRRVEECTGWFSYWADK